MMSNFSPLFSYVKNLVGDGPGKLPSAVIGVADCNGIIDVQAFNARDDAIYLLFSVTKPFVGMAMAQLWERGLIGLNDSLRNYVPDFSPARTDVVTLWHLLTHTSGIDQATFDMQRAPWFPDDQIIDPRKLLRIAGMQFRAGTHRLYNNLAFWAMQEVIEKVSDVPLHEYLNRNIFEPLGAKDISFFSQIKSRARVMPTHGTEGLINYERYVKQESPAAGLFATARDLLTVGQALLKISSGSPSVPPSGGTSPREVGGRVGGSGTPLGAGGARGILAPLTLKAMTTPQTVGIPPLKPAEDFIGEENGLLFFLPVNRNFYIVRSQYGHNGWGGCMFWMYPDQGVCFALMTNLMDPGLQGIDLDRIHNVFAACLG